MARATVAVLLAVAALAGCGGGDDGGAGATPTNVSADRAAAEASETKTGLDRALERYREGDRVAAADEVRRTREDHFRLVEVRLRDVDPALTARLIRAMERTLPKAVDDGVTVSQLAERLVDVEADLDDAVVKLRAP